MKSNITELGRTQNKREMAQIKKIMKTVLTASPRIPDNTRKALEERGIDLSNGALSSNAGMLAAIVLNKALSGDLDAIKLAFEMSGQTVTAKERMAEEQLKLEKQALKLKYGTTKNEGKTAENPNRDALLSLLSEVE